MNCLNCKKELRDDSNFCKSCGTRVDKYNSSEDNTSPNFVDIYEYQYRNNKEIEVPIQNNQELEIQEITQTQKKVSKWGWGWFLLIVLYTNYNGKHGHYENTIISIITFLSLPLLLICYFWLRNYIRLYYNTYLSQSMISFISGIISWLLMIIFVELSFVISRYF